MPISVSTDLIRPAERQAFWTEAICRSFANVETRPIGAATVSGHFEFVEIGSVKLVRFDSSPQCYSRDARLVSKAGSDDFMFDFQTRGRSRDDARRPRRDDRSRDMACSMTRAARSRTGSTGRDSARRS